jgi:sugar fermentation stimulation protein A
VGECRLADEVRRIATDEVPGFGSSDCGCPGHLFRFEGAPDRTAPFQEMLTRLRHDL